MLTWLTKLDPNTVVGALTLLASVAAALWHKAKGDTHDTWADTFEALGRQLAHDVLANPALATPAAALGGQVRDYVTRELWAAAQRIGIPKTAATSAMVAAVVEQVSADVLDELKKAAGLVQASAKGTPPPGALASPPSSP